MIVYWSATVPSSKLNMLTMISEGLSSFMGFYNLEYIIQETAGQKETFV